MKSPREEEYRKLDAIARAVNQVAGSEVAETYHSGGGIWGVMVRVGYYEAFWGTANDTWGADVYAGDSYQEDSSINTNLSTETEDLNKVAKVIWSNTEMIGKRKEMK